jgi:hypothetical protein
MELLKTLFGYTFLIAVSLGLLGLFIEAIKCAFNLNRDYKTAFKKKSDFDNEFENLFKKYFNNTETLNPEDYDIDISIKIKSKS